MQGHIYALTDVRFPYEYRYVGKTTRTLRRRLLDHRRSARGSRLTRPQQWMQSVGAGNLRLTVLGEYSSSELNFYEHMWIAALLSAGHCLTNLNHGGGGYLAGYYRHTDTVTAGIVATRRAKFGIAWGNYTEESRALMAAGARNNTGPRKRKSGYTHSEEWKAHIAEGQRRAWEKRKAVQT